VSDVIRGIAEQSSRLALNAAIDTALAGEQGRGFAAVADAVRSLVSRTQQATVDKAQTAADSLDRIVSSVALISDRNTQIASTSEEQSSVAHEIDRSVVKISQATDELFSRLGETLHGMVSKFKTS
jgi:methyl-accepting chemotaxis protein